MLDNSSKELQWYIQSPLHSQISKDIDNKLTACLHKLVVADDVLLAVQFEGCQCVPVVDLHDGCGDGDGYHHTVTLSEVYMAIYFYERSNQTMIRNIIFERV